MKLSKNKIKTPGYFIKRMRDSGYVVIRLFQDYNVSDPRSWSVMINPGHNSLIITCYRNRENYNDVEFELNDGGRCFPRNFFLKTDSLEVMVNYLVSHSITGQETWPTRSKYLAKKISQ